MNACVERVMMEIETNKQVSEKKLVIDRNLSAMFNCRIISVIELQKDVFIV